MTSAGQSIGLPSRCCWLLATLMAGIFAGCTVPEPRSSIDAKFETMVGVPLNACLRLSTDKEIYRQGEWVTFWVENRSEHVLLFENQLLGLRAFRYDSEDRAWVFVDLGTYLGNPEMTEVPPGSERTLQNVNGFRTDFVDQSLLNSEIRLLVMGKEKLKVSGGRLCGAYADIIVTPP